MPMEMIVHRAQPCLSIRASCNLGDALELLLTFRSPQEEADRAITSLSELVERAVAAGQPPLPVFQVAALLFDLSASPEPACEG
jgi:hypothetical protein